MSWINYFASGFKKTDFEKSIEFPEKAEEQAPPLTEEQLKVIEKANYLIDSYKGEIIKEYQFSSICYKFNDLFFNLYINDISIFYKNFNILCNSLNYLEMQNIATKVRNRFEQQQTDKDNKLKNEFFNL